MKEIAISGHQVNYSLPKRACGSIDRASTCGAEGLGFDPYWVQVSVGGF